MSAYEPTRDSSGFHILTGPSPSEIWIESDRLNDCMAYYREKDMARIAVSPAMGFSLPDLEFLKDHPYVRGISLPQADRIDISGLRYLPNLEYLLVAGSNQLLDLGWFRELRELRGDWHPRLLITSASQNLRVLAIWKYRARSRDLTELAVLPALEDLAIVQSPLISIRGVGRFRTLRRLELSYLTKLESIAAITELKDGQLEILDCQKCRKISDHDAVKKVPCLRVVKFNDCGEIPSIAFLDDMPNLEEFRFVNTNVVGGTCDHCCD